MAIVARYMLILFPSDLPYNDRDRNYVYKAGENDAKNLSCIAGKELCIAKHNIATLGFNQCPKEWVIGLFVWNFHAI